MVMAGSRALQGLARRMSQEATFAEQPSGSCCSLPESSQHETISPPKQLEGGQLVTSSPVAWSTADGDSFLLYPGCSLLFPPSFLVPLLFLYTNHLTWCLTWLGTMLSVSLNPSTSLPEYPIKTLFNIVVSTAACI